MVKVDLANAYDSLSFVGRVASCMQVSHIRLPLSYVRSHKLNDLVFDVHISLENLSITKEHHLLFDLWHLNLTEVAVFPASEDGVLVRHRGRSKRQHVLKRLIPIGPELAYLVGLYDAEGAENSFRFTNSDPDLVQVFLNGIQSLFGLKQHEFDGQLLLVNNTLLSSHAKDFWHEKFPEVYIYPKASFKKGDGVSHGSLSILINTTCLNLIWNELRKKLVCRIQSDPSLSYSYISGVLDGDGCVNQGISLTIQAYFDAKKGCESFSSALASLGIYYQVVDKSQNGVICVLTRGWDNLIRLFNHDAFFRYPKARRNKFLRGFFPHRRSKMILRFLSSVVPHGSDLDLVCESMYIQKKHKSRVHAFLLQLTKHKMVVSKRGRIYLTSLGKIFLEFGLKQSIF